MEFDQIHNHLRISFASKFQIQRYTEKELQAAIWVGEMNASSVKDVTVFLCMGGWW